MIVLENVSKTFGSGSTALSDISLQIEKGEFVFLVGETGSGKTSLIRLLVRELLPTTGSISIDDFDIVTLPSGKIPALRKKIGVIFQDLKLLVDKTILENITLPMEVAGVSTQQSIQRAEELLEQVGIFEHKEKFPVQLSGGELQRAAIARALALSPDILLADEPTGNLDEKTAFSIVELLDAINQLGTTIIMATHNMDIVEKLKKRVVALEKGKIILDKGGSKKDVHKEHKKDPEEEDEKDEDDREKESMGFNKDEGSMMKDEKEGEGHSAKSEDKEREESAAIVSETKQSHTQHEIATPSARDDDKEKDDEDEVKKSFTKEEDDEKTS